MGALLALALLPPLAGAADPAPGHVFTADDVGFSEGGDTAGIDERFSAMDTYLGAKKPILRIDLFWELVQPCRGCAFDWTAGDLDKRVDAAHARGFRVLLILDYAPDWANGHPGESHWLPTDLDAWRDVVAAAVRHFGDKVQAYEIWNEPNLFFGRFGDGTTSARATRYWRMAEIAYPVIKSGCPDCVVLAGASAGGDAGSEATDWLAIGYAQGKGAYFDAVTYHPYPDMGGGHLPSYAPTVCTGPVWYRWWSQFGPDDPACGGLAALYDVMKRNGDGDKKIWGTEFGFSTAAPREPLEARFVRDALEEGVRLWRSRPYTGPLFIYSFQSADPHAPVCASRPAECAFGLRDFAGNPREPMFTDVGTALRADPWPAALEADRSLFRGSALRSPNGRYTLWMQNDGNLVLYQDGSRVLWARGDLRGQRLTNQGDGNLVLYDHTRDHMITSTSGYANPALWSSGTSGTGRSTLLLQDDGNLVLYRNSDSQALWSTGTYTVKFVNTLTGKCLDVPSSTFTAGVRPQVYTCNGTAAQQWIHNDERILTRNNLCLDSNPVQLSNCTGGAAQRWQLSGGALRNPQSGRCLTASATGAGLQISTCDGTSAQKWTRPAA